MVSVLCFSQQYARPYVVKCLFYYGQLSSNRQWFKQWTFCLTTIIFLEVILRILSMIKHVMLMFSQWSIFSTYKFAAEPVPNIYIFSTISGSKSFSLFRIDLIDLLSFHNKCMHSFLLVNALDYSRLIWLTYFLFITGVWN